MSDDPKALDVRISELESAVKKLTDTMTPMAGTQTAAICSVCQVCSVCAICHVCHVCSICRICRPICNECTCGPCLQQ